MLIHFCPGFVISARGRALNSIRSRTTPTTCGQRERKLVVCGRVAAAVFGGHHSAQQDADACRSSHKNQLPHQRPSQLALYSAAPCSSPPPTLSSTANGFFSSMRLPSSW